MRRIVEPEEYCRRIEQAVHGFLAGGLDEGKQALVPVANAVVQRPPRQPRARTAARSDTGASAAPSGGGLTERQKAVVLHRDGFTCTHCGRRLVAEPILRLLGDLYPTLFPYHRNGKYDLTHPAVWA